VKHELGTIEIKARIKDEEEKKIDSLTDVTQRYKHLENELKEHLYAIFLTSSNEVIGDKLHGLGTNQECGIDIQDLVRTAALVNAAAVILVHNHPSSNSTPTDADIETTAEAKQILNQIGVKLLDHVIISRNDNHSMKQHNPEIF
jgi:DNA repair protein RadC